MRKKYTLTALLLTFLIILSCARNDNGIHGFANLDILKPVTKSSGPIPDPIPDPIPVESIPVGMASIGPNGGMVFAADPKIMANAPYVIVPPGALNGTENITATIIDPIERELSFNGSKLPDDQVFVELGPEGLEFNQPVKVVIPYFGSGSNQVGMRGIFYLNSGTNCWEPLPSLSIDTENSTIMAETRHFSIYTAARSNIFLDLDLYRDSMRLFGRARLATPFREINSGDGRSMHDVIISEPQNVRIAYRVSLKRQNQDVTDPSLDWIEKFVPSLETKVVYYRIDGVDGDHYSVVGENEEGAALISSSSRGDSLDMDGTARYLSNEPLLLDFAMPGNAAKKYFIAVDVYFLKGTASLETATGDDMWGGAGYRWVTYSDAKLLNNIPSVSAVDANGDGIIDSGTDSWKFDRPPQVTINSPVNGSQLAENAWVNFSGSALDPEDGILPGDSLVWSSDKDGVLGSGLELVTRPLSLGTHNITLKATDSTGKTAATGIILTVTPESPVITARIPAPNSAGIPVVTSVYVTFSKEMAPASVNGETFYLRDKNGIKVNGLSFLDGRIATFTPSTPLIYGGTYTVTVTTGIRGANGAPLVGNESWNFMVYAAMVMLEPATYENNGTAYFGGPMNRLARRDGNVLEPGIDFYYGADLFSIYDSGNGGYFSEGAFLRVVENGSNIVNKGIAPVAADLSASWLAPAGLQCNIDPVTSKLVMPRPVYWSKCEVVNSTFSNEIKMDHYSPEYFSNIDVGKLGNCMVSLNGETSYIKPFGSNNLNMRKGSASWWGKTQADWGKSGGAGYYFGDLTSVNLTFWDGHYQGIELFVNSILTVFTLDATQWTHILLLWDLDGIGGSPDTIRIFVNGQYIGGSSAQFVPAINTFTVSSYAGFGTSVAYGDNLKVWNHVVSGNSWWIYNYENNAGNEGNKNNHDDALHEIYGPSNNYRPRLTGGDSGVGYYYVPQPPVDSNPPTSPTDLREIYTGSSDVKLKWGPSTDSDGTVIGYNVYVSETGGADFSLIGTSALCEFTTGSLGAFKQYYFVVRAVDNGGKESAASGGVYVFIEPDLSIVDETGSVFNGTSMDFGNACIRETVSKSFRVKNSGDINLDLTSSPAVVISGPDAACFSVTAQPASSVVPGGETGFTLAFKPDSMGEKSALVTILSTDADRGNLSFTVRGSGRYGRMDLALYNPMNPFITKPGRNFSIKKSQDGEFSDHDMVPWDLGEVSRRATPVSIDVNGDGRYDLALYDPQTGIFHFRIFSKIPITNSEFLAMNIREGRRYAGEFTYNWDGGGGRAFAGDFNNDGYGDIGVYNASGDGMIRIRFGNGSGGFSNETDHQWTASNSAQVMAGDFNGDGKMDLGVFNAQNDGRINVLGGNGAGGFSGETSVERFNLMPGYDNSLADMNISGAYFKSGYDGYHKYSRAFAGDFNGDGIWDIGFVYNNKHYYYSWSLLFGVEQGEGWDVTRNGLIITCLGNGDGTYQPPHSINIWTRDDMIAGIIAFSMMQSFDYSEVKEDYSSTVNLALTIISYGIKAIPTVGPIISGILDIANKFMDFMGVYKTSSGPNYWYIFFAQLMTIDHINYKLNHAMYALPVSGNYDGN